MNIHFPTPASLVRNLLGHRLLEKAPEKKEPEVQLPFDALKGDVVDWVHRQEPSVNHLDPVFIDIPEKEPDTAGLFQPSIGFEPGKKGESFTVRLR